MAKFVAAQTVSEARPSDLAGHTLLVWTREYVRQQETSYGPKPAVRVDVVDLTTGEEYPDLLWFGHRLTRQLSKVQKDPQLGRMVRERDDDENSPWVLATPRKRDLRLAERWSNDDEFIEL